MRKMHVFRVSHLPYSFLLLNLPPWCDFYFAIVAAWHWSAYGAYATCDYSTCDEFNCSAAELFKIGQIGKVPDGTLVPTGRQCILCSLFL